MPCIRCGRCADACPASLLPQQLYWFARAKEFDKAENHHLFDCIECACCSHVCPSHIPLVDYYRFAKAEVRAQRAAKEKAEHARQRHDFQLERQERAKRERAEKLAKHKESLQKAPPPDAGSPAPPNDKQSAIQAALERTKARKAALAAASATGQEPSP
jgi:electron transport complex protein RnfC